MREKIEKIAQEAFQAFEQILSEIDAKVAAFEDDNVKHDGLRKDRARRALANPHLQQGTATNARVNAQRALLKTLKDDKAAVVDGAAAFMRMLIAQSYSDGLSAWEARMVNDKWASAINDDTGVPLEVVKFFAEMLQRGVPSWKLDLLTSAELDWIAAVFNDKCVDYRHENQTDVFAQAWRRGEFFFKIAGLSDDEKAALNIANDPDADMQYMAVRFLNETAGRDLGLSPEFALAILRQMSRRDEQPPAFQAAVELAYDESVDRDISHLLRAFGLSDDEWEAAWRLRSHIIRPELRMLEQRYATAIRENEAAVDVYMDAATKLVAHFQGLAASYTGVGLDAVATPDGTTDGEAAVGDTGDVSPQLAEARVHYQQMMAELERKEVRQVALQLVNSPSARAFAARANIPLPDEPRNATVASENAEPSAVHEPALPAPTPTILSPSVSNTGDPGPRRRHPNDMYNRGN